jgi:hypothetical protein
MTETHQPAVVATAVRRSFGEAARESSRSSAAPSPAGGAETGVQLLVPALGRLGEQEAEVVSIQISLISD